MHHTKQALLGNFRCQMNPQNSPSATLMQVADSVYKNTADKVALKQAWESHTKELRTQWT